MDKKMMENCKSMMHSMHKGEGGMGKMMGGMSGMGGMSRGMPRRGYFLQKALPSFLSRPLAVFSLGATVGALIYKNRKGIFKTVEPATKEVVRAVTKTSDASKDFVQEQKEKLSDIIAEVKEEEEESAKQRAEEGSGAFEQKGKLSGIAGEEEEKPKKRTRKND